MTVLAYVSIFFSFLKEKDTIEAQNWASVLFQDRKTDARFDNVEYQEFFPTNSLSNCTKIDFLLPRFTGPLMYLPYDMQLKVDVTLTNEDGSQIADGKSVGPSNLVLHTLFSECRFYLEDYSLNEANENYGYKAFLTSLLTLDSNAKYSWLQAAGFFHDTAKAIDDVNTNNGFDSRRDLFLKGNSYSGTPVTFVGKILHELVSSQAGIIPGISMRLKLTLQNQDFIIMTDSDDKYKLTIVNASLFCPVAQLKPDVFRTIQRHLKEKPVKMYYQKIQVTHKVIPSGSQLYVTESLFPMSELPSRLVFGFLPTSTFLGNPKKSPYNFQRKWSWQVEGASVAHSARRNSLGSRRWISGGNTQDEVVFQQTTKTVFLEKVSLTLNGKSVDGFDGRASENDDTLMFMRLNNVLGYTKTRTGNNLTRTDFHNGYFFCAYDLTTSGNSGMNFLVPSVRLGNLRLNLEFSGTIEEEMTIVIYAEFPSMLTIDQYRRIRMTYV